MKKAAIFTLMLVVFTLSALFITTRTLARQTGSDQLVHANLRTAANILAATVQVSIFPVVGSGEIDVIPVGTVYEQGLATLVQVEAEVLLVSHDHWSNLENAGKVEFRDAGGKLLLTISGGELTGLIRFRDGGTLQLQAPPELYPEYQRLLAARAGTAAQSLLPAQTGSLAPVAVGRQVTVAHRTGANREQVGLTAATIVEVFERQGKPVLKLKSTDGQVIQPGDSGGGIWLDGKLVGNMWLTEWVPTWVSDWRVWTWSSLRLEQKWLDTSIAAQLPSEVFEHLAGESQSNVQASSEQVDWNGK